MKSRKLLSIQAVVLLAALAIPLRVAAQEQPRLAEVVTGADPGTANPVPLINQPLVPDARRPGGSGFKLTVNGTGFVSGSKVNWNGTARSTTFVNSSRLTASILAADIATPSTASVTVINPSPGGGTSNPGFFEVTIPTSSIGLSTSAFGAGSFPVSVATGDFNGDGKLDLAVANITAGVSVLLGNGDGTFQVPVNYAAGLSSFSVAVGDFNGDGKLDLVVTNENSNNVSVLLGNGDGTFQPHVDYGTGSCPISVAVGDFNGDGRLDVAVANSARNGGTSSVSILLGKGDGTFETAANYGTGTNPVSVAVGDFNGDGKLDLATANITTNNVSVLLGNGDGTFQAAVNFDTGTTADWAAVGDFNGDGKLDLAVVNSGDNDVSILLGKGDGTFQAAANYGVGNNPTPVAVGDFNGDGKLDLAVVNTGDNDVSVLLGKGDGTFQAAVDYPASPGSQPSSLAVGDFNRDGRLDMTLADYEPNNSVSILLQISGPRATLSATSLTFATQLLSTTSAAQVVTLSNYGSMTLGIKGITIMGVDQGDFSQANTCGSSVAVGASCTISVTFKPTQIGTRTATLSIADNAPGSPQTVSLSGTGTVVELVPTSLIFSGCATSCPPQTVTLTNVGSTTLSISSITISGLGFSETNTCGSSVGAGKSCNITVTFKGSRIVVGDVSVIDNGGGSPQTVHLLGF
jgi:hypothetical protein